MLRALLIIIGVGFAGYTVYAFYYYMIQRTIIYPRHVLDVPAEINAGERDFETIWLEMEWGKVEAWFLPPFDYPDSGRAPVMIIAHANAELIDDWPDAVREVRRWGMGVLLVEYPGYGRSEGSPSQKSLTETFVKAYDMLIARDDIDESRIVVFGRSLGGCVACALADERPTSAMILLSTCASVRSMARQFMIPGFLILDPFDNIAVVKEYEHPVLVIHGKYDNIFPYEHGMRLHEAARDGELISLECGHNDCIQNWTDFWRDVKAFLRKAGVL